MELFLLKLSIMKRLVKEQLFPILLTIVICAALIGLLWLEITILNNLTNANIGLNIQLADILIGMTIYLKTSIDFAIYIGRLMSKNRGLTGRVAIELGTAIGNAAGTMIILALWVFFKDIKILLTLMIVIAAAVLLRLAEESLEDHVTNTKSKTRVTKIGLALEKAIKPINNFFGPALRIIVPQPKSRQSSKLAFWPLLLVSMSVPFILGLDDFAGYVPLFNVVHIFGFAIGVFIGHMILNIFLYLSPRRTIAIVKNRIISLLGSIAFIGLAIWGLIEATKILFGH